MWEGFSCFYEICGEDVWEREREREEKLVYEGVKVFFKLYVVKWYEEDYFFFRVSK